MNKMKFLTISVVLLLVLNAVSLFILFHMHLGGRPTGIQALHGMHGGGGPEEGKGNGSTDFIVKELKLDDEQQKKFTQLRDTHHDLIRRADEEDRRLHDLYFSLLKTDNPDQKKVDSIATLIGMQRKTFALTAFSHFQQLRELCREDQKKYFDVTIDEIARMVAHNGPPH